MKQGGKQFPSSARQELAALGLLTAATALFFWPVWIAGYTFPIGGGDLFGQLYPVWNYVSEWLRRGIFPLWSTRLMAGDPIIAELQYGLLNPLNWPLFLFHPIPRSLILWRGAFPLWWAGMGLYFYLRRSPTWRLSRSAALVGALAYMFADSFVTHLGHPQFNDAMAWLPWALWAVEEAARRSRRIPWAAGALALIILAGHGQASLYSALAVGLYALWVSLEGGLRHAPRRLGRLALVGLLAAALAAPAVLPGLERLPFTARAQVPIEQRHGAELTRAGLVDFLNPLFHGRGVNGSWLGWARMETGYGGAVALYLVPLGLLTNLRRRRAWWTLLLGGLAFLYALGYSGPLYPSLARLPIFAESWRTIRMIFVLSLALALGAALGMEQLRRGNRWGYVWAAALVSGGLIIWLQAPARLATVPAGQPQMQALTGFRLAALLAWGLALLSWAAVQGWHPARAGVLLLLLSELVALGALVEANPPDTAPNPHTASIAYLKSDPGWFRVDVDATARGLWSPSGLLGDGFEVPQGTGNPMELEAFNQFYWSIPTKGSPAYRLLGVKYIIVPKGALPGGEGIWPVYLDNPLVDIHLNTRSLNRIWLVYRTQPVSDLGAAYQVVLDPEFAPEQVATVEKGPWLDGTGSATLEALVYTPNRISVTVNTTAPVLLVLSDLLYPGWTATVDGQATPIYRTDGLFRGVMIPAGTHALVMRFFPVSLRLGLGAAGMALWGLLFTAVIIRGQK